MTDLSIIIVSYKGWSRLIKCLEALDSFSGINFKSEVIVVDNNSGDAKIFEIEKQFPRFRFIYNKINGGFGNGCNLGAENVSGEYLLFLNPDTVASEEEIFKLLDIARQNAGYTILSCSQVNEKGKNCVVTGEFPQLFNLTGLQRAIFRKKAKKDTHLDEYQSDITFPDWISGSVVLISRINFNALKGFDEDFWMYYEDVDICRRVYEKGGKVAFSSSVKIEHNHGGSSRINLKTTSLTKTEVLISRHIYISKHTTGISRFIIQTFLVLNNIITIGLTAVIGLILFFIPRVLSRSFIFFRILKYYAGALFRLSWRSPRSLNSLKDSKIID